MSVRHIHAKKGEHIHVHRDNDLSGCLIWSLIAIVLLVIVVLPLILKVLLYVLGCGLGVVILGALGYGLYRLIRSCRHPQPPASPPTLPPGGMPTLEHHPTPGRAKAVCGKITQFRH